jgi:hypothetical protein
MKKCGTCMYFVRIEGECEGRCTYKVKFPACCYAIGYQKRGVQEEDGARYLDSPCPCHQERPLKEEG